MSFRSTLVTHYTIFLFSVTLILGQKLVSESWNLFNEFNRNEIKGVEILLQLLF